MNNQSLRFITLCSAVSLLASTAAFALDSTWLGIVSSDWHDAGNWSGGIPQDAGDYARFNTPAAVAIASDITLRTLYATEPVTITVGQNATLAFSNSGGLVIEASANLLINGTGNVTFSRNGTSETDFADMKPAAGATITIAAPVSGLPDIGVENNGAGALRLTSLASTFTGYSRISGGSGSILFHAPAVLGPKAIALDANLSKAVYDGPGATSLALPIIFNSGSGNGTLENAGGGTLTLNGDVYAKLAVARTINFASPDSQPIIVNGVISNGAGTVSLSHTGPGPLTLAGANTYTGTTTLNAPCILSGDTTSVNNQYIINQDGILTLTPTATINGMITVNAGGTLAPENGTTFKNRTLQMNANGTVAFNPSAAPVFAVTLPVSNIVNGADVRWLLPASSFAITVPTLLQQNNGTLDIIADTLGDAQHKIILGNFGPGPLPGWITVNGGPATYSDSDGLHAVTASGTPVNLPALGPFNIPDAAASEATINSQGTSGSLTLAADPTSLFSLTQAWADNPTTIDLGGKTLAVNALAITAAGNHLTLANGTLTGASPVLAFRNDSDTANLTVNAGITETAGTPLTLTKSGDGDVILGGSVTTTGPVLISDGALTFATPAGHTNTLAAPVRGAGALVKTGPGGLILSQTNPYTGGTVIKGGTLIPGAIANPLGATTAPVRIEDGGALDIVIGVSNTVANPVLVQGHGPDGLGALRNTHPTLQQQNAFRNVTLTNDTSVYATSRFDVRTGTFDFGGHDLTVNGGSQFSIVSSTISGVTASASVHAENGTFTFETSDFQGSPANTASASPGAIIALYNMSFPMQWTLALSNNAVIRGGAGGTSTNINVWAGPVQLPDTAARFYGAADGVLNFPNPITGTGGVIKEGSGWVRFHNTANTYQGATTVTQGTLYATAPGSLGTQTTTGLTVTETGTLFVRHAPDGWTKAQIEDIATTETFTTPSTTSLGIDTVHEDLTYDAPTYPNIGLHKTGPHKLTFTSAAPSLGSITVYDGELDLTGTHNLHNQSVTVGAGNTTAMTATLRLENTALDTDDPGFSRAGPTFFVGNIANGRGIIHVGENTRLNGRLRMGVTGNTSAGAIYQTGGTVTNTGGTGNIAAIGVYGYGYYRLEAGEFASKGQIIFGENSDATAIFEQLGGAALINPGGTPAAGQPGDYYGGTFTTRKGATQFMLSGGTFNLSTHSMTLGEWGGDNNDGTAVLTTENDAHIFGLTTVTLANRNNNAEAYINLNGGTFTLRDHFIKGGNNTAGNNSRAAIAFNGGTLQVVPTTSAPVSLIQTANNNSPTLLNVYEGGANIDTASAGGHTILREPLRAPASSGVTAVNITSGGAGYIAPPFVSFTDGGGIGATAFAEIDLDSGAVTNIRVTSPGVGYTSAPTVKFRAGGHYTALATATATIGANTSGGLTKTGPGLLSLEAENTYTGPTTVTDGTLRLGAGPKTLSANTAITLDGGTLDLGGDTHTNYNPVTIQSGGIVNGTLTALSFSKTGDGTATLSASLAGITSPSARINAIIHALDPVIWYDPSDTTPGNIELSGTRVTRIRNKGRFGELLDAVPYNNGTGPLLNDTVSPLGAITLHIDNANASMVSASDIPGMTGFAERTLVALIARDSGRACVGIGHGEARTFEIGNDETKTYLTGASLDLNFEGASEPRPPANQFLFIAANNGHDNNFIRGVQLHRSFGATPLESKGTIWASDNNIAPGPFIIARRGGDVRYGKHGDMLLFDRVLTPAELTTLKDALVAKYMIAPADAGEPIEIPPVSIEAGTLVLSPPLSEDIITRLNPVVWYDPADTSPENMTVSNGRVTRLRNKGFAGNTLDAIPYGNGAGPLLLTGPASVSPLGASVLHIDNGTDGTMTTAGNVPITGDTPRTLVALLARGSSRVSVGIGSGDKQTFEIGNDPSKTYLTGSSLDLDFVAADGIPGADKLTFIAANNGFNGNLSQGVQVWRSMPDAPPRAALQMKSTTWASPVNIVSAPFCISRRGTGAHTTGKVGEVLLFNKILSESELTELKNYLVSKWMTGQTADGSEFNGVIFDVADGATLDLSGARDNITVTGQGTITNGTLGAGFTISPAGDNAIGTLALNGITIAPGATYRLTTDGAASDRLHIDGDLSDLTVVPATDAEHTSATYVIATGAITHKPALSGEFPSKYKLRISGTDLLLTSDGGTLLILK